LFCWYWWNCWRSLFKLSFVQFHQYQQNKRKFKQWASTIPPISTKQKKVWTVSVNNSTNINKTKESLNSERQQFHQYQQNK
jgi:hypothetical protein